MCSAQSPGCNVSSYFFFLQTTDTSKVDTWTKKMWHITFTGEGSGVTASHKAAERATAARICEEISSRFCGRQSWLLLTGCRTIFFFLFFFFVCRQNPSIFHRKLGQALPFFRYFKPNNDVFAHPNQVVSGFKLHYKEKLRLNDLLFCRIVCNSYLGDRVDCVASAAVCTSELYQSAPEQPQRCR